MRGLVAVVARKRISGSENTAANTQAVAATLTSARRLRIWRRSAPECRAFGVRTWRRRTGAALEAPPL
jgi:hypothetical protein